MKYGFHAIPIVVLLIGTISLSQAQDVAQDVAYPMQPGKEHDLLQRDVGTWDAEITMWTQGQDAEATKSNGVETVRMLGELWTVRDFEYGFQGQPTHGHGMFTYDPLKKKYQGVWCEAGSPYPAHLKGDYDEASREMTLTMKSRDLAGSLENHKIIIRYVDDGHKTFELQARSKETREYTKIMEIRYTKR